MDIHDKFERALEKVQKAPRYTGGEMNTAVKGWEETPLHFGFCFQDTYEIGKMTVSDPDSIEITNKDLEQTKSVITYRFTDIYGEHYWTPAL